MVEEGLIKPREDYRGRVRRVKYSLTEKGWEYIKKSNDLTLRILYTALGYREALRNKIKVESWVREEDEPGNYTGVPRIAEEDS